MPAVKNLRRHWHIVLVLAVYLSLAVAYSVVSPIYEPTDELRHFRYVRHIVVSHELPVQRAGGGRAQSHHPPLYYALGALASWWAPVEQEVYYSPTENPFWGYRRWEVSDDNKNLYVHGDDERFPFHGVTLALYVVRWMTALIGAATVWLTYRVGREVFGDRVALAAGGAALVAFNPQFVYLSGAVNNDVPAALCGAAVLLACVRLVRAGPSLRADVAQGALLGLALLTKFHLLALLGLIELAYLVILWRTRDWRAFLRSNLIVLGLAGAISGWWFWRNYALYGDPTGMSKVNELWIGRPAFENWWAIKQGLPYLWSSLWGRFGYGQVPLPQGVYRGLLLFCALALAGHLIPRRSSPGFTALMLLWAPVLTFMLVVSYYMMIQPAGPMGRFLFPALPAFALLLSEGLSRFFPRRLAWTGVGLASLGMAALAVYALVGVLYPAFAPPRPLTASEIGAVPNPVGVDFGGAARLLGYRVAPTTVKPGQVVEVTAYWQALARTERDHVVFVHLLSDVGAMVAQRDTYPGLGRYPTTAWEPGVAFADTYRMHVPETAYAPDEGYVQVGVYVSGGPRLFTSDGRDAVRLAEIEVEPLPGQFPNPLEANFDDKIALLGYTLDRRVAHPGETIHLTLYWQALTPMEENYSVFAQALSVGGEPWAHSDGWPAGGRSATGHWEPGDVVEDVRQLRLGEAAPPGFYDVQVGLHSRGAGRLPVVAEDGRRLDNRVLLSKVRVVEDE